MSSVDPREHLVSAVTESLDLDPEVAVARWRGRPQQDWEDQSASGLPTEEIASGQSFTITHTEIVEAL